MKTEFGLQPCAWDWRPLVSALPFMPHPVRGTESTHTRRGQGLGLLGGPFGACTCSKSILCSGGRSHESDQSVRVGRAASQLLLDSGQGAAGKPFVAHIQGSLFADELPQAAQRLLCRKTHTDTQNFPLTSLLWNLFHNHKG